MENTTKAIVKKENTFFTIEIKEGSKYWSKFGESLEDFKARVKEAVMSDVKKILVF